jgi:hypothetical protein
LEPTDPNYRESYENKTVIVDKDNLYILSNLYADEDLDGMSEADGDDIKKIPLL